MGGTDIEAPAPEDRFEDELAAKGGLLQGTVRDAKGRPVGGADVWVEVVDLRQPVHNLPPYRDVRADTLTRTDGHGRFELRHDGAFFHVAARAGGGIGRVDGVDAKGILDVWLPEPSITIIAHRGASFYAPENTLVAIEKAAWLGADAVELDVRMTVDERLVVFHDADLNRTGGEDGLVDDSHSLRMLNLDVGSWMHPSFAAVRVPTLEQAMDAAHRLGVQLVLDVKATAERVEATRDAVFDAVEGRDVVVAAFRKASVEACVERGLTCAHIANATRGGPAAVDRAVELGASHLLLDHDVVNTAAVARAKGHGLTLWAWTVNEPERWDDLVLLGVDGILTDRPGYLSEALAP